MKFNKENALAILGKVKAAFNIEESAKFVAVAVNNNAATLYINTPAIALNGNIYADEAMTLPAADGTYTIDATGQSITVAGGIITAVVEPAASTDPAPAAPAAQQQAAPAPAPQPAPVPVATTPQFNINLPETFAAFETAINEATAPVDTSANYAALLAIMQKFAVGTPEERIANIEVMCRAMMEYCFGYEIRQATQKAAVDSAINTYKELVTGAQTQLAAQQPVIKELVGLFESFLDLPTTAPQTVPEHQKNKFGNNSEKEARIERIAAGLKMQRQRHENA